MNASAASSEIGEPARSWAALGILVGICLLAGAVGGLVTSSSVDTWYPGIEKPSWNPPKAIFGPVWTTLYVMMAFAAWLVWRRRAAVDIRTPMALFASQLALNALWSVIFFGLRRPGLAFLEILLLWLAIVGTLLAFRRVSTLAGNLLLPYLGWVTFAAALNFAIWRLNA